MQGPESAGPQDPKFTAGQEGMPRFVYTQDQLAEMPDHMRESILAGQAAGQDLVEGMPIGEPTSERPIEGYLDNSKDNKIIDSVPLSQEQRQDFDAKRAAEQTRRDAEPVKHGGYNGVRLSQMPGAVGGPIRIDGDRNPQHGQPRVPKLDER